MIFGEMEYPEPYMDFHERLCSVLQLGFSNVETGLQGDSWIRVSENKIEVSIDTFTSMKHQIKSAYKGPLVYRVLAYLSARYTVRIYESPVLEGHEV